jgi:hypothetical protein
VVPVGEESSSGSSRGIAWCTETCHCGEEKHAGVKRNVWRRDVGVRAGMQQGLPQAALCRHTIKKRDKNIQKPLDRGTYSTAWELLRAHRVLSGPQWLWRVWRALCCPALAAHGGAQGPSGAGSRVVCGGFWGVACPCFDGMWSMCRTLVGTAVHVSTVWFVLLVVLSHAGPSCAACVVSHTAGRWHCWAVQLAGCCAVEQHTAHQEVPSREPLPH